MELDNFMTRTTVERLTFISVVWITAQASQQNCEYTICPKKNYNRTFRMDNFQSSE